MADEIQVGEVRWHWATNVVCAGPEGRLIVLRALGASRQAARLALCEADNMEWRDRGFRRWRIRRCPSGITFVSHYQVLGPVPLDADKILAALSNSDLERLLDEARRTEEVGEGTLKGPRA